MIKKSIISSSLFVLFLFLLNIYLTSYKNNEAHCYINGVLIYRLDPPVMDVFIPNIYINNIYMLDSICDYALPVRIGQHLRRKFFFDKMNYEQDDFYWGNIRIEVNCNDLFIFYQDTTIGNNGQYSIFGREKLLKINFLSKKDTAPTIWVYNAQLLLR